MGAAIPAAGTEFSFPTGKVSIDLTDGVNGSGYVSNSALSVGTFHHIATTVDGQTVAIYIDGHLDATYPQTVTPFTNGSNPLQIGGILNLTPITSKGSSTSLQCTTGR